MDDLPPQILYEGVSIDILFAEPRPRFGDLFRICGATHPRFPPIGAFMFERLVDLQFDQVDDYFGVRSLSDEGADVAIWLYPLVDNSPVDHHAGPFDGVRLEYNILRNPERRANHFLRCVEAFAKLGTQMVYRSRGIVLEQSLDLEPLRIDIAAVVQHWASRGIVVGSDAALAVDY